MSATVLDPKERIHEVHIEGLALLKIVKHCHEALPQMVTGSLLGLVPPGGRGILEVTHAFPNPDSTPRSSHDADGDAPATDDSDFQMDMMRLLREVNVDNNCVGWYQSMYLGIYSTTNVLENQLSYQTDLSPTAVVIVYDPLQTTHGTCALKCLRLRDTTVQHRLTESNAFVPPSQLFETVPLRLTNPGLVRAYLTARRTSPNATTALSLDRLDLSTNPYLEKHLEFLCVWVDDLAVEHGKFQHYARSLTRSDQPAAPELPRRVESLLIANQIQAYVTQMQDFGQAGLSKLYLAGGVHQEDHHHREAQPNQNTT